MHTYYKKTEEKVFNIFNILLQIILALTFLIPFVVILSTSFVSEAESARRGAFILWPDQWDPIAYQTLLSSGSVIYKAYAVTIFRVCVGTLCNILCTCTLAYGLTKKDLPGVHVITILIFFTMLFNGGLIPTYMVVKSMGLIDSLFAMIIPSLISTWNLLIMRTFFSQIPESLEESAMLDGATPWQILYQVIIPLSIHAIATVGLFYAVAHWNAWFDAAIYINSPGKRPVQTILREIVLTYSNSNINNDFLMDTTEAPPAATLKSAAIIVTTTPIVLVYPFIQKYFVKGIMIGAIKG